MRCGGAADEDNAPGTAGGHPLAEFGGQRRRADIVDQTKPRDQLRAFESPPCLARVTRSRDEERGIERACVIRFAQRGERGGDVGDVDTAGGDRCAGGGAAVCGKPVERVGLPAPQGQANAKGCKLPRKMAAEIARCAANQHMLAGKCAACAGGERGRQWIRHFAGLAKAAACRQRGKLIRFGSL